MKTKAIVTVKLQIEVQGLWASAATIHQIHKQSKDSAMTDLLKVLKTTSNIKLIDDMKSSIVMVEE